MTNSLAVRNLIKERGLKLSFIAEKLKITRYCLSMKIDNKTEFKSSEIATLCEILNVESLELKEKLFFAQKVD